MKDNTEAVLSMVGLAFFVLMCWAAVDAFGWLHGTGIIAAVWFVAPYRDGGRR